MKLSKPLKHRGIDRSKITDRITFITDDCAQLVIPVGPRFQAEIPPWTPPVCRSLDNSKWIGTQIWPTKGRSRSYRNKIRIGRGRPETCECAFPGSIECVREHVSEKRLQLKIDLGPAFWLWKFDEMGEDVSKLWSLEEEKKFKYIVKTNPNSRGKSFVKMALKSFPGKSRVSIASYYLNVYIPRRIGVESRSNCITIDTDEEEEEENANNMLRLKGTRKRLQASRVNSCACKYMKSKYLTGRH